MQKIIFLSVGIVVLLSSCSLQKKISQLKSEKEALETQLGQVQDSLSTLTTQNSTKIFEMEEQVTRLEAQNLQLNDELDGYKERIQMVGQSSRDQVLRAQEDLEACQEELAKCKGEN